MTSDLIQTINETFLNGKITGYSGTIYIDLFPAPAGTTEASKGVLMARHDPSTYRETTYMDKSRVGIFNFAYYAKSGSMEQAREWLDQILALLDLEEDTPISDGCQIRITPVTSPVFASKTEKNEYIYTASLTLEYYKEG